MSSITAIRISKEDREIIKRAASRYGLKYQTYLKIVVLEHARHVNSLKDVGLSTLKKRPKLEIIDEH